MENDCAGPVSFVETVKLSKLRARPGRPAPSPTRRESRRRRVVPQTSPSPPGQGDAFFENQEKATKISATTVMSMVRVRMVSMAVVPNEA